MKSGWSDEGRDWSSEYYRSGLDQISDLTFVQATFSPVPALVARHPKDGYRLEREYTGQEFDPSEFDFVPTRWDHQHCNVCEFKIESGHTYWQNTQDLILCDVCHDYVQATQPR